MSRAGEPGEASERGEARWVGRADGPLRRAVTLPGTRPAADWPAPRRVPTSYPGPAPAGSYLLVGDRVVPLVVRSDRRERPAGPDRRDAPDGGVPARPSSGGAPGGGSRGTAGALVLTVGLPDGTPVDDVLADAGVALLGDRVPVLAYGANRSPDSLALKLAPHAGGGAGRGPRRRADAPVVVPVVVPVLAVTVADADVVAAGLSVQGFLRADLVHSPGTRVAAFVTLFDPAQAAAVHESEGVGRGTYDCAWVAGVSFAGTDAGDAGAVPARADPARAAVAGPGVAGAAVAGVGVAGVGVAGVGVAGAAVAGAAVAAAGVAGPGVAGFVGGGVAGAGVAGFVGAAGVVGADGGRRSGVDGGSGVPDAAGVGGAAGASGAAPVPADGDGAVEVSVLGYSARPGVVVSPETGTPLAFSAVAASGRQFPAHEQLDLMAHVLRVTGVTGEVVRALGLDAGAEPVAVAAALAAAVNDRWWATRPAITPGTPESPPADAAGRRADEAAAAVRRALIGCSVGAASDPPGDAPGRGPAGEAPGRSGGAPGGGWGGAASDRAGGGAGGSRVDAAASGRPAGHEGGWAVAGPVVPAAQAFDCGPELTLAARLAAVGATLA